MRKFLVAFFALFLLSWGAHAACVGGTNGTATTPALLNGELADNMPPGSITPGCFRDMMASAFPPNREYTIAPFGAPWGASFYCTATDCSAALTAALNATKNTVAGTIGGHIVFARGTYPFTTNSSVCDLNSVDIEGASTNGMFAGGGTVWSQNANVEILTECNTTNEPTAIRIHGIHFLNNASATSAMVHTVNTASFEFDHNFFDQANPALTLERPFDFWIDYNQFYNCGTNSTTQACVRLVNSTVANGGFGTSYGCSGGDISHNRFEDRPGASIYVQASGTFTCNDVRVIGNKFEGIIAGSLALPAITGSFAQFNIVGNKFTFAGTDFIDMDSASSANVIVGNNFGQATNSSVIINGNSNNVAANNFMYPVGTTAHVTVNSGCYGCAVFGNTHIPNDGAALVSDSGNTTWLGPDETNAVTCATGSPTSSFATKTGNVIHC